jgi:hypothetical protein
MQGPIQVGRDFFFNADRLIVLVDQYQLFLHSDVL